MAWGAPPVATLDSSSPFLLRGATVQVAGIGDWPVFAGDRISTLSDSALLKFQDRSYVLLARQTNVELVRQGAQVRLRVIKGQISYQLSDRSSLILDGAEKAVSKVGTVTIADGAAFLTANPGALWVLSTRTVTDPQGAIVAIVYPVTPPSGVTLVPGPEPVSAYRCCIP